MFPRTKLLDDRMLTTSERLATASPSTQFLRERYVAWASQQSVDALSLLGRRLETQSKLLSKQHPIGARMMPLLLDHPPSRRFSVSRPFIKSASADVCVRDDKAEARFACRCGKPVGQREKRCALTLASVLRVNCE